jgi:hypothetical protein
MRLERDLLMMGLDYKNQGDELNTTYNYRMTLRRTDMNNQIYTSPEGSIARLRKDDPDKLVFVPHSDKGVVLLESYSNEGKKIDCYKEVGGWRRDPDRSTIKIKDEKRIPEFYSSFTCEAKRFMEVSGESSRYNTLQMLKKLSKSTERLRGK